MFLLLFVFVIVCGLFLFEWKPNLLLLITGIDSNVKSVKHVCRFFFIVFLYMYCSYQEERVGIALKGLTPPHCVPTTGYDLDSQPHMLWSFFCAKRARVRVDCAFCQHW